MPAVRGKYAHPVLYGLILAAGYSSRMGGEPKALLSLGPGSMLEMAVTALRDGGASEIFVVTGHAGAAVAAQARCLGVETVPNPAFDQGMFSSICAGFRHVVEQEEEGQGPAGVFLLPVDAPLVQPWTVSVLAGRWRALASRSPAEAARAVFVPGFRGRGGHPPLLGMEHAKIVLAGRERLSRNGGLRAYLASLLPEDIRGRFLQGLLPGPGDNGIQPETNSIFAPPPESGPPPPCPVISAGRQGGEPVLFMPLADQGILADLDRPEDCAQAKQFLRLTGNRRLPSPEEAREWLQWSGISPGKLRHSIKVALAAVELGKALAAAGKPVDLPLHASGGLLHDCVRHCSLKDKKCKAHARRGQDTLLARGWDDCALVVGAHTVLPDSMLAALGLAARDVPVACRMTPSCRGAGQDAAVFRGDPDAPDPHAGARPELLHACVSVYLADKYFFMDKPVTLEERFGIVLDRFSGDEEAIRAISRRLEVARLVRGWFLTVTGMEPEQLAAYADMPARGGPPETATPEGQWERCLLDLLQNKAP